MRHSGYAAEGMTFCRSTCEKSQPFVAKRELLIQGTLGRISDPGVEFSRKTQNRAQKRELAAEKIGEEIPYHSSNACIVYHFLLASQYFECTTSKANVL